MNKLILPWPPRPLSPNASEHWAVVSGAKKRYRLACFMLARQTEWVFPEEGPIHLDIEFVPPNKRDNAGKSRVGPNSLAKRVSKQGTSRSGEPEQIFPWPRAKKGELAGFISARSGGGLGRYAARLRRRKD